MTTCSYLTLADGTLVDFEHDYASGTVQIRAGRSLFPHERPILAVLTLDDAREFSLHLLGFIVTREAQTATVRPRVLRLRYRTLGGHVHCRLFTAAHPDMTFAKSGDLVFAIDEWADVRALLVPVVEIVHEDDEPMPDRLEV